MRNHEIDIFRSMAYVIELIQTQLPLPLFSSAFFSNDEESSWLLFLLNKISLIAFANCMIWSHCLHISNASNTMCNTKLRFLIFYTTSSNLARFCCAQLYTENISVKIDIYIYICVCVYEYIISAWTKIWYTHLLLWEDLKCVVKCTNVNTMLTQWGLNEMATMLQSTLKFFL